MHEQVMHSNINTKFRGRCHSAHLKRDAYTYRVLGKNKVDGYGSRRASCCGTVYCRNEISSLGTTESWFGLIVLVNSAKVRLIPSLRFCRITSSRESPRSETLEIPGSCKTTQTGRP